MVKNLPVGYQKVWELQKTINWNCQEDCKYDIDIFESFLKPVME